MGELSDVGVMSPSLCLFADQCTEGTYPSFGDSTMSSNSKYMYLPYISPDSRQVLGRC